MALRTHRVWVAVGLGGVIAALAACGTNAFTGIANVGSSSGSSVATVQVTPDTLRFTDTGQTSQLTAVALDSTGTQVSNATFTWSSSSVGVATVATDGTVTSVGAGTTTVTAASGSVKGSATVVVTTPSPVSPQG